MFCVYIKIKLKTAVYLFFYEKMVTFSALLLRKKSCSVCIACCPFLTAPFRTRGNSGNADWLTVCYEKCIILGSFADLNTLLKLELDQLML